MIETYSDAGDVVYKPVCGSGLTLIACDRPRRLCLAVEISPKHVDVAIDRVCQQLPGVSITLEATGQTFDVIAAERGGNGQVAA